MELEDTFLTILLLFLNVLHQVVENGLALEAFFLGLALFTLLEIEDLLLALERLVEVCALDLGGDEVFLHTGEHVLVRVMRHILFRDLSSRLFQSFIELLDTALDCEDWALSFLLLGCDLLDFLLEIIDLLLFKRDKLSGLVMLLFDLAELLGHFSNLILLILVGSRVVGWLEKSVCLDKRIGTIADSKPGKNNGYNPISPQNLNSQAAARNPPLTQISSPSPYGWSSRMQSQSLISTDIKNG